MLRGGLSREADALQQVEQPSNDDLVVSKGWLGCYDQQSFDEPPTLGCVALTCVQRCRTRRCGPRSS